MRVIWDSKRNWTIVFLLMVIALMLIAQNASPEEEAAAVVEPVDIDLDEIAEYVGEMDEDE